MQHNNKQESIANSYEHLYKYHLGVCILNIQQRRILCWSPNKTKACILHGIVCFRSLRWFKLQSNFVFISSASSTPIKWMEIVMYQGLIWKFENIFEMWKSVRSSMSGCLIWWWRGKFVSSKSEMNMKCNGIWFECFVRVVREFN